MNASERAALLAAESENLVYTIQLLHACARAILALDSSEGLKLADKEEIRRLLKRVDP